MCLHCLMKQGSIYKESSRPVYNRHLRSLNGQTVQQLPQYLEVHWPKGQPRETKPPVTSVNWAK